jgi:hypothetical protein
VTLQKLEQVRGVVRERGLVMVGGMGRALVMVLVMGNTLLLRVVDIGDGSCIRLMSQLNGSSALKANCSGMLLLLLCPSGRAVALDDCGSMLLSP